MPANPLVAHQKPKPGYCKKLTKNSNYTQLCPRPVVPGQDVCKFHSKKRGSEYAKMRHRAGVSAQTNPNKRLPAVYDRVLSGNLKAAIDEFKNTKTPTEQLALYDELALMKHAATQAVAMYDAAVNNPDVKAGTVLAAASVMRESLNEVAQLVRTVSQIEAAGKDKMSMLQVGVIIEQLVRIAYDVFSSSRPDLVETFAKEVRSRVVIPTASSQGTSLTPDRTAIDMDATIPAAPDDDNEGDDEGETGVDNGGPSDYYDNGRGSNGHGSNGHGSNGHH